MTSLNLANLPDHTLRSVLDLPGLDGISIWAIEDELERRAASRSGASDPED